MTRNIRKNRHGRRAGAGSPKSKRRGSAPSSPSRLKDELAERGKHVAQLEAKLNESYEQINALNSCLNEVNRSIVWQLLMGFHGKLYKLMPEGSDQRKAYEKTLHSMQDMMLNIRQPKIRIRRKGPVTAESRMFDASAIKSPSCVYVASKDHWPNELGSTFIVDTLSKELPRFSFFIVGTSNVRPAGKYGNVTFTGYIDNLDDVLSACDIALNPMLAGTGTNLKMFSYAAAGLPIVTTQIGARGVEELGNVFVCELFEFPKTVEDVYARLKRRKIARAAVPPKFLWKNIAQSLDEEMERMLSRKKRAASR